MIYKMLNYMVLCLIPALAVSPALADPYDEPYAIVESGYRSVARKELPVAISSIDGVSSRNVRYSDPIAPGRHRIQVYFSGARRGTIAKATRDLDIDLQPCTRYRIVANYEILVHPIWEPKVYAEPIGECSAKFQMRAGRNQSA